MQEAGGSQHLDLIKGKHWLTVTCKLLQCFDMLAVGLQKTGKAGFELSCKTSGITGCNAHSVKFKWPFTQLKKLLLQGADDCLTGPAPVLVHFDDYTTETQLNT